MITSHRLIILSGPSGVGKTPLEKAFRGAYPDISANLRKIILYNSRDPRPVEVEGIDYFFRSRDTIQTFSDKERFLLLDVRGDLQALDLVELCNLLISQDVLYEGNTFMGNVLRTHPALDHINRVSIFLAPISREEITEIKNTKLNISLEELITNLMKHKLLQRSQIQKVDQTKELIENIDRRAKDAYSELKEAWKFDYVIPNHDGEESKNWNMFALPLGDARKALIAFAAILTGKKSDYVEKWEKDLLIF